MSPIDKKETIQIAFKLLNIRWYEGSFVVDDLDNVSPSRYQNAGGISIH